jgi:hypothetical protein
VDGEDSEKNLLKTFPGISANITGSLKWIRHFLFLEPTPIRAILRNRQRDT